MELCLFTTAAIEDLYPVLNDLPGERRGILLNDGVFAAWSQISDPAGDEWRGDLPEAVSLPACIQISEPAGENCADAGLLAFSGVEGAVGAVTRTAGRWIELKSKSERCETPSSEISSRLISRSCEESAVGVVRRTTGMWIELNSILESYESLYDPSFRELCEDSSGIASGVVLDSSADDVVISVS